MPIFSLIVRIVLTATVTALTLLLARYSVHMLQLEGYFLSQYRPHLFARLRHPDRLIHPPQEKKPLKYTARVKRLFVCAGVLIALFCACFNLIFYQPLTDALHFPPVFFCLLALPPASVWVLLAALLMAPVEKAIATRYVNDAKKRLEKRKDLKIVAITGSYGKTSTKFILSTILSEKYACLTPPSSYNTTMGVVRVIRERLQPDDEVFICEMGSRHRGDIREICSFVHPGACILTSIGPQHLDTFGSIEGVKEAKYELVEALPPEGCAVFASSNEDILSLYEKTPVRKLTAGFRAEDAVRAENVTVGCSGSAFTLVLPDGQVECATALLGKHNISNILVAAAMAHELGLTASEIARGIAKIRPVEHRLQIVAQKPVTIIDDAFNSSPNGARAALEVLSRFTGRRVIVTPGFVELGEKQADFHKELGENIAKNADVAILVGHRRAGEIRAGMENFAGEIYEVGDLAGATAKLREISVAGDVVLFENDLPDNYNE